MILDLITNAQAEGLTLGRACEVFDLGPRTIQRWRAPAPAPTPATTTGAGRAHPHNALTVSLPLLLVGRAESRPRKTGDTS